MIGEAETPNVTSTADTIAVKAVTANPDAGGIKRKIAIGKKIVWLLTPTFRRKIR